MPEEVKFTEEELQQIKNIQSGYMSIQNQFGQLKLAQIRLEDQEVSLEETLNSLRDEEKTFLDNITKKYGQGSLNSDTGVFTPAESENKSE
tara:strand:- start:131 stop:403 length:273 start_codon:yes stop_codon:yes gene_type:complete